MSTRAASRTHFSSLRGSVKALGVGTIPWYRFLFVIYFCVCGGAFGYEEAVGTAGPALTLMLTVALPFVWCLPLAFVTAELGCMMPESNEGVFVWIRKGVHPVVSFAAAVVYFATYVVDLALYASLFYQYFKYFSQDLFSNFLAFYIVVVVLVAVVTIIILLGIDLIGSVSTIVALTVMAPFIVTLVWGGVAGYIQPQRDWIAPPPGPYGNWTWADASTVAGLTDINQGFHVCIWSLSGYDALGNVVLQLTDPGRFFGRALIGAIMLSFLTYSTAVIGLLGAPAPGSKLPNFSLWEAGYFSDAAATLGGPTLRIIIIVAGMLSCFGTFQALMLPVSEQLVELCSPSLLDVSFVRRKWKRFGTHYVAIVFNAVITIGFASVPFESLVDTLNFLHSTVVILVLVSFVSLRFSRKGARMFRPFSAVSNRWLSIALVFFPMIISLWMIVGIVWLKTWFAAVGCAVMYAIGVGLYYTCRYRKQKGLLWATKMKPKKPSEQRPDSDKLMGDDQDQGEEEEEVEEEEDLGEEKPLLGDNTTAKPIVSGRQQQTGAGGGAINESF